jgi:lipoprotein-anchoring transpeptidase ErfK/SrfK
LVAVILGNQIVRNGPGGGRVALLDARRPITDERTVLPVLARKTSNNGQPWLRVRLPGRTNGSNPPPTGWIRASDTRLRTTPWHILVDLKARRVSAYKYGRLIRRFPAIVGKPSTPTPPGQYFVEEDVALSHGQSGGPFALATSDRSKTLREFDGGPGEVAIHGLEQLGGRLGTAESHGCIRLANSNITWLAARTGAGTPITIR